MDIRDIKGAKITHSGLLQHNPDGSTDHQKITHAGLLARSPEGTAAKGMNIRGNEDLWVEIQANTFRNWVNEHLRETGMQVHDWTTDFCDGTHLCALVECLQTRPLKPSWNRRPANQHHYLENVTTALSAIEKDHIKLVNIGNVDIVNGNVKLILGLIWSLIVRYQIGRSKFPPRKLMLAWLQASLPECRINNLTTDWNSGVNLAALLDYCQPGLFPHWRSMDPNQSVRNCTETMNIAQREFRIPKVLEPEYLASPWLDELSGMTYLSYFMKPGGPGYKATMRWVNSQVKDHVSNFTTDWNDGRVFCEIIRGLGGSAPAPEKLSTDPFHYENNIRKAVEAGEKLGVKPVLTPKDMANPDVEHLGIMAYAAQLQWVPPRPPLSDMIAVHLESTSGRVGEPTHFRVEVLSREISLHQVRAYVVPPTANPHPVHLDKQGEGTYIPEKYGMHEITVEIQDETLGGHFFRVLPRYVQVAPPGMAPCALGSLVEVLVNATGAPKSEDILVTAVSPSGRSHKCPLKKVEEGHSAIFKPDEAGIWEIAITYQGRHIQGGPFTCAVFDPTGVSVHGLDGAMPLRAHSFEVDARGVGVSGELHVDIVHEKHSLVCSVEKLVENKFRVTFMPRQNGKYRVYIYFNGYDVKGSPYIMRVGTKGRSGKTRSSPHHDSNRYRSESPSMHYTTSTAAHHTDFRTAKKELFGQEANKQRSYSPQYSPKGEDYKSNNVYISKREVDSYSPKLSSPVRDTYSPKTTTDIYSTTIKKESRKHIETKHDYYYDKEKELYQRKNDRELTLSSPREDRFGSPTYVSKTFSENFTNKQRNSVSPVSSPVQMRSSPGARNSPLTIRTSTHTETVSRNLTASPKNVSPRNYSSSPSHYITSATHRMSSPVTVSKTIPLENSRHVEKSSFYKATNYVSDSNLRASPLAGVVQTRRTISPDPELIDHSSNVRVSSIKPATARRDSWDVINKTKHILSHNSLESLANMTESQLNTDLSYNRPDIDNETERNTRYNKFSLAETKNQQQHHQPDRRGSDGSDKYRPNTVTVKHNDSSYNSSNTKGPAGQSVPAQVHQTADGVFKAEFVPRSVGEHRVSVSVKGQATAGSPYAAKVYDVNAIKVKNVSNGTVGKPVTFLVETSQAGPGNLEVTVNGGRVPTSAQAQGQHTYAISFTPRDAQNHTVELRFNGQDVPGSPFTCRVSAAARILSPESMDKVSVGRIFEFVVESDIMPIVEVLGPARRSVPAKIDPIEKGFKVKFEPLDVGDHSVEVRLPQSDHVEGSPFLLKAYSAEKVIVTDIRPGIVGKSVSFGINASQAGAGNLEIIVAVNGKNVPNFVQSEGNARFKVNFKPTEAAPHSLSVRFNGHPVPGSPFTCHISPAPISLPKAMASGESLKQAAVKVDNTFELEGFEGVEPQIFVTSPSGDTIPCMISHRDDVYVATFRPTVVGRHLISVTANDQHINGSPFSCNVFDVSRVSISGLEQHEGPTSLGVPVTFSVDAAGAGEGTLELVVSTETSTVKAEVVACARGLYDVTFIPQTCEPHFVNITFNDVPVDGSPFRVEVQQSTQHLQVGSVATIDLASDDQIVEITGPDHKPVAYTLNRNLAEFRTHSIGNYIIRFIDRETRHYITTRTVSVFDPTLVKISEVGEALCHRPATIAVSLDDAGQGTLTALVRCGSLEVPHSIRGPSKNGVYEVVYHPTRVAPHKIAIMYNGVPISTKSLEINIQPPGAGKEINVSGLGLYQARVGKTTSFSIDTTGRPAREFDVVVSGPGGEALPVRCYQTKGGHLQAEFTINKIGQCLIEVLHQSKPLPGSPFTCEAYDTSRTVLQGVPKGQLSVQSSIIFTVKAESAGTAELEAFVLSPIGQNLPVTVTENNDGLHTIEFTPNMPGHYKAIILYGGEPVPGTPLNFSVSTTGSKSDTRASGNGLEISHRGKETSFVVYCPTTPNVQIERIDEHGERIEPKIKSLGSNEWKVSYTILSVGKYEIRASCPNRGPLPGSPWTISCVDSNKVSPVGGWGTLLDHEGRLILPARIMFDVSQAGPGELVCTIDGREVQVEKQQDGKAKIYLSADNLTPGEHDFDLTWSGVSIIQCPGSAFVTAQQAADKVQLTGRGLAAAQVNEAAHFTIDATEAPAGRPEVILTYQDGTTVPVSLAQPRPTEPIWLASYTPQRSNSGPLNLSVKWNGRVVKGCPLSVAVGSSVDSSKVICSGEGLRHGVVGEEIKSWIDTRRAGPGELTAHCAGPRKVAYCELYDHGDATFTLNIKPQEPGRHLLTIKYGGQHVTGSPFALKVAGAPDASKVRVYGPGIEHGVLATFQSRFICDTRGAGAGQLTVRVRGPKGAFRVEMQRESQKDRTILCKYDPTEPGDYRVEVKWAGDFVPGSPFPVMIFDTEEELRRYLQGI